MAARNITEAANMTTPETTDVVPIARPGRVGAGRYMGATLDDVATLTANLAILNGSAAPGDPQKVTGRRAFYVDDAGLLYFHNGNDADAWAQLTTLAPGTDGRDKVSVKTHNPVNMTGFPGARPGAAPESTTEALWRGEATRCGVDSACAF